MAAFTKTNLFAKKIKATLLLSLSYMGLLILAACIENVDSDPFGGCSNNAIRANIKDFDLVYEPYLNGKFSSAANGDEVNFKEFRINLRLDLEQLSQSSTSSFFPGSAYALSCAALYDIRNISNIAVILTSPFEGLPTGTDISYLLFDQNDIRLSELRDFSKTFNFISLTLQRAPSTKTQLKTRTIIFLKNGTQKIIESTSPTLIPN